MSLIERALQKARTNRPVAQVHETGVAVETPVANGPHTVPIADTRPVPILVNEFPRQAPQPELQITEALLREKGLRAEPNDEAQQRAEYRHIKHALTAELREPDARRILLITSALQGEGKSFSAAHLAMSLSIEPDYTVLLVDADVIRPNLTRTFGLADRQGIMDAVADPSIDVQSLIVTTSIEGLSILPAGRPHENATEHFASARMHEVIEQLLSVPNRIVVIDSLPLLMTTEARALAPVAGQIVMVVRAESTPQSAVMEAVDLLGEGANVKLLLNAVVRNKALGYLGFEYGYGYNYKSEKAP
jgi:receptor protein-tyrosine kinase